MGFAIILGLIAAVGALLWVAHQQTKKVQEYEDRLIREAGRKKVTVRKGKK